MRKCNQISTREVQTTKPKILKNWVNFKVKAEARIYKVENKSKCSVQTEVQRKERMKTAE